MDLVGLKDLPKQQEMDKFINKGDNSFKYEGELQFDQMSRYCFYDAVDYALLKKPKALNSVIWLTSGHMSYHFYHFYDPNYFKASMFIFSIVTFNNMVKFGAQ